MEAAGASTEGPLERAEPRCYRDAAMMAVGLAATALPFACSHAEEAERWLRILRVSGAVGNAMQAVGVPEDPLAPGIGADSDVRLADPLESVLSAAEANGRTRAEKGIATEDLLVGVHQAYGPAFDYALAIRGTTVAEVFERVERQRSPRSA
jgi:hypothetical protein